MRRKYVIVGGAVGGISAATRLRRLDEYAEITLFEKEPYISAINCGLPYYIGGVISSEEDLAVESPESLKKRYNIDVVANSEVVNIDRHENEVAVRDIVSGKMYRQAYDKLILATGAVAEVPDIEGIRSEKVFCVRNIDDAVKICGHIEKKHIKRATVIGGGFVGLEVAENLAKRGINTNMIELSGQVLPVFDYDMAQFAVMTLEENGISLVVNTRVETIVETEEGLRLTLSNEETIYTDMAVFCVGVRPEVSLAKKADLGIGVTGGIIVDEHQQTTDKDIYAVGDAVEVDNLFGGKSLIPLASTAGRQGRIAADNIYGIGTKNKNTLSMTILKLFDMNFGCTGLTEKQLGARNERYEKVYTFSLSKAVYCPGAEILTIKTLFEKKSGKLFGVQIVGRDGVDKWTDVFATAIKAGFTVEKLAYLGLAFAPPFGADKDAVNMAGYAATDVMYNLSDVIQWHDVKQKKNAYLLDVRTKPEYEVGTIEGAVNIPLDELRDRIDDLPKTNLIIVFSKTGRRSYIAERILKQHGYRVKNLTGGYGLYDIFTKAGKNGHIKI